MGSSAEMERVVQGLRAAQSERMAKVKDVQSRTRQTLAELGAKRQVNAAQERQYRTEYMDELSEETGRMRQIIQALLQEYSANRQESAGAQRQQLGENTRVLGQDVGELRRQTQALLQEMAAVHQMMASTQREALMMGRANLSEDVAALRQEAQAFVGKVDEALQSVASDQREWLARERSDLCTQVAELRSRFSRERREVRADLDEARRIWARPGAPAEEIPAPTPEVEAPAPSAPEPFAPMANVVAAEPATVEPVTVEPVAESVEQRLDDLTVIGGIGPAMQRHLRRAGIDSFAQLASSTPEYLRQAVGEIGQLAKVDEWIAEAQRLSETV